MFNCFHGDAGCGPPLPCLPVLELKSATAGARDVSARAWESLDSGKILWLHLQFNGATRLAGKYSARQIAVALGQAALSNRRQIHGAVARSRNQIPGREIRWFRNLNLFCLFNRLRMWAVSVLCRPRARSRQCPFSLDPLFAQRTSQVSSPALLIVRYMID